MSFAIVHAELYRHGGLGVLSPGAQITSSIRDCDFQVKNHASEVLAPSQKGCFGRHGVQRMHYPSPTEVLR